MLVCLVRSQLTPRSHVAALVKDDGQRTARPFVAQSTRSSNLQDGLCVARRTSRSRRPRALTLLADKDLQAF